MATAQTTNPQSAIAIITIFNQLNQILLSEGKYDELQKASKDKEYQKKLLAEYGLLNEKQGE